MICVLIFIYICVQGSDCDENTSKTCEKVLSDETLNQGAKTCADCGTTKTPLWRGGPAGPKVSDLCFFLHKQNTHIYLCLIGYICLFCTDFGMLLMQSLCNACGIRSRKRKRALLGLSNKEEKKPKKNNSNSSTITTSDGSSSNNGEDVNNKMANSPERRPLYVESENVLQRPRSNMSKKRRMFGEEERRAAMLLMSLSCGSVFAY